MHSYGKPDMTFTWTWIGHDMGPAVTALFKNYTTRLAEIEKQTFVVASGRVTAEEMAVELAKGALHLSFLRTLCTHQRAHPKRSRQAR